MCPTVPLLLLLPGPQASTQGMIWRGLLYPGKCCCFLKSRQPVSLWLFCGQATALVLSWTPCRLYIYFKSQLNEWTLNTVAWIRDIALPSQVLSTPGMSRVTLLRPSESCVGLPKAFSQHWPMASEGHTALRQPLVTTSSGICLSF